MEVMKFGVVSVGEIARLREMARLVKEAHAVGRRVKAETRQALPRPEDLGDALAPQAQAEARAAAESPGALGTPVEPPVPARVQSAFRSRRRRAPG